MTAPGNRGRSFLLTIINFVRTAAQSASSAYFRAVIPAQAVARSALYPSNPLQTRVICDFREYA